MTELNRPLPESGDWREVLSAEDAANLSEYSRSRKPFTGVSPTLLVVDVTEAFVGPNLPVFEAQKTWRQACGDKAWAVVPAIRGLLEAFRAAGRPVIFTTPDGGQRWTGPVTRGTTTTDVPEGREIIAAVEPREDEWVLRKPKASAFFGTPLVSSLTHRGCDSLVVAGGTTSGCVRATAVDGSSYGFEMLVAEDGCFDRATLNHMVNLADLDAKYARVLPAAEILALLGLD
ncbi:MAG: isochorismatase family protein [bacterium]|nr:isochorismatase family protein [Acidimicrobiia bacterium]MCY4651205.1 isochorismatase family protein [bacterium]